MDQEKKDAALFLPVVKIYSVLEAFLSAKMQANQRNKEEKHKYINDKFIFS